MRVHRGTLDVRARDRAHQVHDGLFTTRVAWRARLPRVRTARREHMSRPRGAARGVAMRPSVVGYPVTIHLDARDVRRCASDSPVLAHPRDRAATSSLIIVNATRSPGSHTSMRSRNLPKPRMSTSRSAPTPLVAPVVPHGAAHQRKPQRRIAQLGEHRMWFGVELGGRP